MITGVGSINTKPDVLGLVSFYYIPRGHSVKEQLQWGFSFSGVTSTYSNAICIAGAVRHGGITRHIYPDPSGLDICKIEMFYFLSSKREPKRASPLILTGWLQLYKASTKLDSSRFSRPCCLSHVLVQFQCDAVSVLWIKGLARNGKVNNWRERGVFFFFFF